MHLGRIGQACVSWSRVASTGAICKSMHVVSIVAVVLGLRQVAWNSVCAFPLKSLISPGKDTFMCLMEAILMVLLGGIVHAALTRVWLIKLA